MCIRDSFYSCPRKMEIRELERQSSLDDEQHASISCSSNLRPESTVESELSQNQLILSRIRRQPNSAQFQVGENSLVRYLLENRKTIRYHRRNGTSLETSSISHFVGFFIGMFGGNRAFSSILEGETFCTLLNSFKTVSTAMQRVTKTRFIN